MEVAEIRLQTDLGVTRKIELPLRYPQKGVKHVRFIISPDERDGWLCRLVLRECPFCRKLLASELVSKEEVDAGEITKQVDVFREGSSGIQGSQLQRLVLGPEVRIERVADHPEAFIAYRLTYRCKDCGKEWTRLSVKEVGIPKSYVEDEEEKTEYDAEKEAEEAREEEYAREEERR